MSARLLPLLFSLLLLGLAQCADAATKSGTSQKSAHTHKAAVKSKSRTPSPAHRRMASRLVPPPPAYMPTILPELYYRSSRVEEEEEEEEVVAANGTGTPAKPRTVYVKNYLYGNGTKPVQGRSGVTTWVQMR